jgi:uncharacterized membrane protein (DUF485 family)
METIDENLWSSDNEGFLPAQSAQYLATTRKWAKFLAILGFIFMGFIAVFGIIFAVTMSSGLGAQAFGGGGSMMGIGMTVMYLLLASIYFFPIYYLYKFTSHMKVALITSNAQELNESFKYLKSHYKFLGIFTIVIFSVYFLALIGMMAFGMSMFSAL